MINLDTVQFWLFCFGVYFIYRTLHNALSSWFLGQLYKEQNMFADYSSHYFIGAFSLLMCAILGINIYTIWFG